MVNNRVQRSGLVEPDLDAREGRFRIRIQNLGGTWMVSGPPSSRPLILHSPESSSAWAKDCGVLLLTGVDGEPLHGSSCTVISLCEAPAAGS